ncbi:MAG: flagellar basal body rod protein FlgB [Candidatus Hydrogenedentes bacterium]|nr:flagellar basal body rod protein FlgB [Candidatus Hydrogenedentota bacterium]
MSAFAGVDTSLVLTQAMKVAELNHTLIANNISNADTPNYNPVSLDFQGTLRAALEGRDRIALRRTDPRHLEGVRQFPEFEGLAILSKNDYNKVDLDHEMTRLSENTGRHTTYGSLLVKRFQAIKDMLSTVR